MAKKKSRPSYKSNVSRQKRKKTSKGKVKKRNSKVTSKYCDKGLSRICSGFSTMNLERVENPSSASATDKFLGDNGITSKSYSKRKNRRTTRKTYSMQSLFAALPLTEIQNSDICTKNEESSSEKATFDNNHRDAKKTYKKFLKRFRRKCID